MVPGTMTIQVGGMSCGKCASRVQKALDALPGVYSVEVALEAGLATVGFDTSALPEHALLTAVEQAGYTASPA